MKTMVSTDGDTSWCLGRATDLGGIFRLTPVEQKKFSSLEPQLAGTQMILHDKMTKYSQDREVFTRMHCEVYSTFPISLLSCHTYFDNIHTCRQLQHAI